MVRKFGLLDLFSGIGGFSIGLERSQMFETVAFCEIEKYCQKVLANHWPKVPLYEDVTTLSAERLARDGIKVDAICGGFPCQDLSLAGKGAGLEGSRSGLWKEYARLIGEIRPRYVIVENVSALLSRGLDRVLADLATLRYDAEWHCIPASAIGAPHRRDRIWIIAYPSSIGHECDQTEKCGKGATGFHEASVADTKSLSVNDGGVYSRFDRQGQETLQEIWESGGCSDPVASGYRPPILGSIDEYLGPGKCDSASWWSSEPEIYRVAYGISNRSHRLKALGNAVVPQIPEIIGLAIKKHEEYYTKRLDT